MATGSLQVEASIILKTQEELELYTGFCAALAHLRTTGSLPSAPGQPRVKIAPENLSPSDVMEIVREHTRVFGAETTLAALHGLDARNVSDISADHEKAQRVYDHLFNRLQEKGQ